MQHVTVLGATGSIGLSTLDVVARHPSRYRVYALTAHSRIAELMALCVAHQPKYAVITAEVDLAALTQQLRQHGCETELLQGVDAACTVAAAADTVMAAIVGAAGLQPTLAAVKAGRKVLLANKEALVMAGGLFMAAVADSGATLLPIDSEHNAIFQCMPAQQPDMRGAGVKKILLTGSGGPFRNTPAADLVYVTPEQACAHPNWSMGQKISVDSATMMNKGLEFVEACWMFSATPDQIEVVVHPESIIHSMVEYIDGSVLAQMGNPDMRTPIAHALAWPERIESGVASLDLVRAGRLNFQQPDFDRFPCLALAIEAARTGGTAAASLNAANEVAVDAFLQRRIPFTAIYQIINDVMQQVTIVEPRTLDDVQQADRVARQYAEQYLLEVAS